MTPTMQRLLTGARKTLIVAATSYLALELTMYVCACAGLRVYGVQPPEGIQEGVTISGTSTVYDPHAGYKWKQGKAHMFRVNGGEVVYDVQIYLNNHGYRANRDFTPGKKPDDVFRIVVLGDSFTAGVYMETPWPDRVESLLNRRHPGRRYEVYNFAVDGSGLANWYSIFFGDIVPSFDFDAVVIASFGDDLRRKFMTSVSRPDGVYYTYIEPPPPATEAELLAAYGDRLQRLIRIGDESTIDQIKSQLRSWRALKPDFYFAKYVEANKKRLRRWAEEKRRTALALPLHPDRRSRPEVEQYLASQLGSQKAGMLAEILDHCRAHSIPVVITSIPTYDALLSRNQYKGNQHDQIELKQIADAFGVGYFDGYDPFFGLSQETIQEMWLRGDGHWGQLGADRFAAAFAADLRKRWPAP